MKKEPSPLPPLIVRTNCDHRLSHRDIERNTSCGIDKEEWLCWPCEVESDSS